MSEERPGPVVTAKDARSRPRKTRGPGFGAKVLLRFRREHPLTEELLAALSSDNPGYRMERTAGGHLEIMAPAGAEGSNKNATVTFRLVSWSENEGRGLGLVFDSSGGFTLPNGAIRSPDLTWIARERWEALTAEQRSGFPPLCPDFVVELRSRSDRAPDLRKKMQEYLSQGIRLGWLIDPLKGRVEIYRAGREVVRLERPATLSGEDVLPGFVLDLKGIFND